MFEAGQLLSIGAAAVIDTVLLVGLIERRNWRYAPMPVVALAAGAWLWHAGFFVHLLLANLSDERTWPLQWATAFAMAGGLLLMPCALLHGAWRLARTGY